jgi:FMN phosphatase YigB (HAD superfamily)
MTGVPVDRPLPVPRAVALDYGHTLIDERIDILADAAHSDEHLMPGAREALSALILPVAIWANTRRANAADIRDWLERAGLGSAVTWVVTSVDAGARKPAREFFDYALRVMAMQPDEVLFVGNQQNTDIAGGNAYAIPTVWLSSDAYRSDDDDPCEATPRFTIATLHELPALVADLTSSASRRWSIAGSAARPQIR